MWSLGTHPLEEPIRRDVVQRFLQVEIDSKEVLSYDVLLDHVHPPSQIRDKGFAKPPGPSQRGARRVTKAVV
ncbi:unnamed protein product [Toxocara canis]|uniref:Uncharacterized protein n=1 Tax=Toxocara canis TaxID=6265 RepID=A0A183U5Y3_TOXCA|nr:unnamed protein product [Toxocara canis]